MLAHGCSYLKLEIAGLPGKETQVSAFDGQRHSDMVADKS
jgi:hypothetical protein